MPAFQKFYWDTDTHIHLRIVYGYFRVSARELTSYDRECKTLKVWNIYSLALTEKSLPTLCSEGLIGHIWTLSNAILPTLIILWSKGASASKPQQKQNLTIKSTRAFTTCMDILVQDLASGLVRTDVICNETPNCLALATLSLEEGS